MGYPGRSDSYDPELRSKAWARDRDSAAISVLTIVMRVGEIIQVWCLCSEKGRVLRTEASEIHTFKC